MISARLLSSIRYPAQIAPGGELRTEHVWVLVVSITNDRVCLRRAIHGGSSLAALGLHTSGVRSKRKRWGGASERVMRFLSFLACRKACGEGWTKEICSKVGDDVPTS